jgi:hypothetical protein
MTSWLIFLHVKHMGVEQPGRTREFLPGAVDLRHRQKDCSWLLLDVQLEELVEENRKQREDLARLRDLVATSTEDGQASTTRFLFLPTECQLLSLGWGGGGYKEGNEEKRNKNLKEKERKKKE